ncbi:MAG TPA: hypothetical protein DEB25_09475, partial [Desulfobulbaceae bacterium]|nr:hypothetical protein [Desulfobulbaceae bacterium]
MNPSFLVPAEEEPGVPPIFWRFCPLARIEAEPSWSIHPFLDEEPPEELAASVRRFGILQPPLVMAVA